MSLYSIAVFLKCFLPRDERDSCQDHIAKFRKHFHRALIAQRYFVMNLSEHRDSVSQTLLPEFLYLYTVDTKVTALILKRE